jgi:hypothetical protein
MSPPVKEEKGQPKWTELGLQDLRSLDVALRSAALPEIEAAQDVRVAMEIIARVFGLATTEILTASVVTPLGAVDVVRESLFHIVEKRQDARERYAHYALDTLVCPFEVWRVEYDDGSYRLAFIGAYVVKNQMLVVVNYTPEKVLWNFMHGDAKAVNKHRHGELLHQRHSAWPRVQPELVATQGYATETVEVGRAAVGEQPREIRDAKEKAAM